MVQLVASGEGWRQGRLSPWAAMPSLYVAMKDVGLVEAGVGGRVQEQSTAIGYLEAWHRSLGWVGAASLPRQGRLLTQRVRARTRTSLTAMALAGSALRGWGREHPQGGRGLGSHPAESPAPGGGPPLPLPLLTHCLVRGARRARKGQRRSPQALHQPPQARVQKAPKVGAGGRVTKGRSGDPVAFPSRAFLPAAAWRGNPGTGWMWSHLPA